MPFDRSSLSAFLQDDMNLDLSDVSDDDPLFSSGLLDSFSMVELMTFIETRAGMRLSPADVSLENLDSISRILAFVERAGEGS